MNILRETIIFGNSIMIYLMSLVLFTLAVVVIKIFRHVLLGRLKTRARETATSFDDFLLKIMDKIISPALYFGAFYFAVKILILPESFQKTIDMTAVAVVVFSLTRFVIELVAYGFSLYWSRQGKNVAEDRSLEGILKVINFIIWAFAVIFALDNMGFKISTVIAGLGIGGVAVALAAQAVLKDLFSYFAILFDRPFEIGDFIIVGDYLGAVEKIGIKTTRIRSLGGEQLIFSNADLTDSRVRNYKRMDKRRVVFKLGVVYQTSLAQLKEMPAIIKNVIEKIPDTVFDRAHFFSYGDFSLVFEVVYYVLGSDYNKYMDIQQAINFNIKEEFESRNIEFAYPTQTLYVNKP